MYWSSSRGVTLIFDRTSRPCSNSSVIDLRVFSRNVA